MCRLMMIGSNLKNVSECHHRRPSSTIGAGADARIGEQLKTRERDFGEATDIYGFSAMPSGQREKDKGTFSAYNADAYFWTTTVAPLVKQGVRRVIGKVTSRSIGV